MAIRAIERLTINTMNHPYAGILFALVASLLLAAGGCHSPARDAFEQAERYRRAGDHERALYFYSEAIEYDDEWVAAYAGRGLARLELGAYAEAVEDFDRAMALGHDRADLFIKRGDAHLQIADYDQAETDYARALEVAPESVDALLGRARCRWRQGRYAQAAEDFSRALEGNSAGDQNQRALLGRGRTWYAMAKYKEAVQDFTALLRKDPSHAHAHWHRALAYDALARGLRDSDPAGADNLAKQAEADRGTAVELDPSLNLSNGTLGQGLVNELRRVGKSEGDDAPVTLDTGLPE